MRGEGGITQDCQKALEPGRIIGISIINTLQYNQISKQKFEVNLAARQFLTAKLSAHQTFERFRDENRVLANKQLGNPSIHSYTAWPARA